MTLPSSGPLSLNDIQTEFGGSNPASLSEYYAGGAYVPAGTTGTYGAVPSSGTISIQNFYGTSNYTGNWLLVQNISTSQTPYEGITKACRKAFSYSTGNAYTLGYGANTAYASTFSLWTNAGANSLASAADGPQAAIAVDLYGSIYTGGSWAYTHSYDIACAQFSSAGASTWFKIYVWGTFNQLTGMTIDISGNVVCSGYGVNSSSIYKAFIMSHDYYGTRNWTKVFGNTSWSTQAYGSTLLDGGNIVVAGKDNTGSASTTQGATLTAFGYSAGALQWARRLGPSGVSTADSLRFVGVSTDNSSNSYAFGDYNTSSPTSTGYAIIAKYNSSGTLQWQRRIASSSQATYGVVATAIATSRAGDSYVIGTLYTTSNGNTYRNFIAKYDSSGALQWQRTLQADTVGSATYTVVFNDILVLEDGNKFGLYGQRYRVTPTSGYYESVIFKLPTDGTKTGTYNNLTYATTTLLVDSAGAFSDADWSGNTNVIDGTSLITQAYSGTTATGSYSATNTLTVI